MTDESRDAGMRVRREVLGDEHVDRAIASSTAFTEPLRLRCPLSQYSNVLWPIPRLLAASDGV